MSDGASSGEKNWVLLGLDPIHGCGQAERAHEGLNERLMPRRHGPPLSQPAPQALHLSLGACR